MAAGTTGMLALVAGAAVVAAVLALLFLVLWLAARRRVRRAQARRGTADGAALAQLELANAEQSGRLAIIAELHEVALGRITEMVAQAEAAQYAGSGDPSAAVRAAGGIAELGRATLADLRRVMTLVREGDDDGADQRAARGIGELIAVMSDAGLEIESTSTGVPFDLNPGAALAVYGIVQEALANALQYGGAGTQVRVARTWTANGLALRIDDTGIRNGVRRRIADEDEARAELAYSVDDDLRALTQRIEGGGVAEMRARAELYGGVLTVTEVPGVGHTVDASFPTIRFHNGVHGVDLQRR